MRKMISLSVLAIILFSGAVTSIYAFKERNEETPYQITCSKCGEKYYSTDRHECSK